LGSRQKIVIGKKKQGAGYAFLSGQIGENAGGGLMIKRISLIAVLLFGMPGTANAYIDPSSGGLLIQMLLAGLAGVAVVARLYWKRLKDRFKRPFKKNNDK